MARKTGTTSGWKRSDESKQFSGPVEVDETYMGGKRRNMSNAKRKELAGTGRGPVGKTAVIGAKAYETLPFDHEAVKHSVSEYVRGQVHTNGMESFWAALKRAHEGTFHKISPKHLNRYVQEFAGKHNVRDSGTLAQMTALVAGLVGKRLMYRDLIADNGLPSGARS